jgi:hypothetical protein
MEKKMNIEIEGIIKINNEDSGSKFSLSTTDAWFQWGETNERLGETVDIVTALQKTLNEEI